MRNTLLEPRSRVGHLHYFTAESALATLKDTGHEIVDYNFTSSAIDLYRQNPRLKTAIASVPRWLVSKIQRTAGCAAIQWLFVIGLDEIDYSNRLDRQLLMFIPRYPA